MREWVLLDPATAGPAVAACVVAAVVAALAIGLAAMRTHIALPVPVPAVPRPAAVGARIARRRAQTATRLPAPADPADAPGALRPSSTAGGTADDDPAGVEAGTRVEAWPSWHEFVIARRTELSAAARAFCFSLRLPEGAADDVFQEACLGLSAIWSRLPEDTRRRPDAYMRGILYNKARDMRRPKRGNDRLNVHAQPIDHSTLDLHPDRVADPHQEHAVDALQRAIDALPVRQREVVVLVKLLDRSVTDTAIDLGVSNDAVRQSLSRALATLRVELAELTGGPRDA